MGGNTPTPSFPVKIQRVCNWYRSTVCNNCILFLYARLAWHKLLLTHGTGYCEMLKLFDDCFDVLEESDRARRLVVELVSSVDVKLGVGVFPLTKNRS